MLGNLLPDTISRGVAHIGGPWTDVEVVSSCGSTNALVLEDARPWRVVAADEQVAGRGRLDRSWSTPPGEALAVSVSLPLPDDVARLAWFSPITAMAMARALTMCTGVRAGWKWPNDVLAARRDGAPACVDGSEWGKVCGILGQVSGHGTVVMGAGVNVAQAAADLPVPHATSVAACGGAVADAVRERVLVAFLGELADLHSRVVGAGLAGVREGYRRGCLTLGRTVRAELPGGRSLQGQAVRVDDAAELVVAVGGAEQVVAAGDVVHLRAAGGGYVA